jgi:hypothetical protein
MACIRGAHLARLSSAHLARLSSAQPYMFRSASSWGSGAGGARRGGGGGRGGGARGASGCSHPRQAPAVSPESYNKWPPRLPVVYCVDKTCCLGVSDGGRGHSTRKKSSNRLVGLEFAAPPPPTRYRSMGGRRPKTRLINVERLRVGKVTSD